MIEQAKDKKKGYIKLSRVEKFILKVGSYEDKIFKKRLALHDRKLRQIQAEFEQNVSVVFVFNDSQSTHLKSYGTDLLLY